MKHYKPQVKAKIVETTKAARAEGKKWKQAHQEAKGVGYKGSLASLVALMKYENKAAGKKAKSIGKKRGRKAGRKPMTARDPITAFIEQQVEERLQERVKKAIAVLKGI